MGTFRITGGKKLSGTIKPQGAKNEALQVLCSVLLTDDVVRINNIPDILDVQKLIIILKELGVKVKRHDSNSYSFKADGIDLSDDHWEIINFLREYYEEYQIAPAVRVLTKAVGKKLGKDKGNSKYLYELFPYGPGKQACKFAGLPKPTGCV